MLVVFNFNKEKKSVWVEIKGCKIQNYTHIERPKSGIVICHEENFANFLVAKVNSEKKFATQ